MDKPMRKIVHEYSDFWKLQTESFDSPPKRYVHCVKLLDTHAPYPLLSTAVQNHSGPWTSLNFIPPPITTKPTTTSIPHSTIDDAEEYATIGIAPVPAITQVPQGAIFEVPPPQAAKKCITEAILMQPPGLSLSVTAAPNYPTNPNSRVAALDRERPKLTLAPRTLPRELPPLQSHSAIEDNRARQYRQAKELAANRQKQLEAKKRAVLAAAFNSDSEDDHDNGSNSDWELGEAEFSDND